MAGMELVKDGINGYIVPVNDQEALIRQMKSLLSQDHETMGRQALETIRDYTIEKMAQKHVAFFDKII